MLVDRTGEIEDRWREADAAPLGDLDGIIVPFERIDETEGRSGFGLHLPNTTEPTLVEPHFGRVSLISVAFPSFSDGRGFSVGRKLRELGYAGRLRATGPVIADQFAYLLECGFDEVAVPESVAARQPAEQWLAQLERVTLAYQRGRTGRGSILEQRRATGSGGDV